MKINSVHILEPLEQQIVELTAKARQDNKELTGWNGSGTVSNDNKHLHRNIIGFGAEFIFCKYYNLHCDYSIGNTSKKKGTDNYDAVIDGFTIDVKTTEKNHPLMIAEYLKSDVDGFAFFHCNYPKYIFKGFATNELLFQEKNKRQTLVKSYVLEIEDLLNDTEFLFLTKLNKQRNDF